MLLLNLPLLILFVNHVVTEDTSETRSNNEGHSPLKNLFCSYNSFRNFTLSGSTLLGKANSLCTHFTYNGVSVHPQKGLIIPSLSKFAAIKEFNKTAKLILYAYAPLTENDEISVLYKKSRKSLIKLIIQQLRSNNLDGIGLHSDFIFDTSDKRKPKIITDFSRDLRTAIDEESESSGKPKLILIAYTGLVLTFMEEKINVSGVLEYVQYFKRAFDIYFDWVFISNDNYFKPIEQLNALHHPLNVSDRSLLYTDDVFLDYFLNQGVKPEKLIFVLFTYGYVFTMSEVDNTTSDASLTPGISTLPYQKICQKFITGVGWSTERFSDSASGAYSYRGDQWISYQDSYTFIEKTRNVLHKHLGGVVIVIPDDDFTGDCYNKMLILTEAAKEVI